MFELELLGKKIRSRSTSEAVRQLPRAAIAEGALPDPVLQRSPLGARTGETGGGGARRNGGFKAVVWTDVFQAIVMLAGFGSIIIQTSKIQGGLSVILRHAEEGGRLNLWDFNISPLQRHTFWTILIGGTFTWTSIYGINQSQVQRYVSCKSKFHAKLSLYLNLVGLFFINIAAVFCGLSLYSVYHNCDPWTSKKVWSPDQLMPYLAIDILQRFPGLSGLFVAAAYSGTLSTVSSSITALACVTLEDVIKPHLDSPSERTLFLFSKGTCLFYGIICIGMAALASLMGSMLQAALSIFGMIGGPLLGLFTLGILFPLANSNGAFIGILCGFITSLWIGVGAYYYPPPPKRTLPLPLSVANCSETRSMYLDWTNFTIHGFSTSWDEFYLSRNAISRNIYSLSYLYLSTVGTLVTIIVGLIASLLTGGRHQTVDKKFFLSKDDTSFGGLKKVNQVEVSESLHSMKTLEGSEKPGEDQDIDQKLFLIKDDSSFGSFKKINQVEVSE
ncbi:sodium-coupled monocarboxylate transporter 1 isoform X2 [Monodelphis domestica]|uniref:sodium-coupled monocarboxylate transporter 1 isoform X2 n=1 Tax=Monodelphis domestica TaxID=13616 RepID=UPI000443617F|nr:sodium-coupled monocarboxylate transporter 1 isoform X2 [Monodelphis domestica]